MEQVTHGSRRYTWHSVETLTPSVSLSSWSMNGQVRSMMHHLYHEQQHEFDTLQRRRGRMFALRAYIDTLISEVYGPSPYATQHFMEHHIASRYRGLEHIFPSAFANITAAEIIPRLPMRCRGAPRVGDCALPVGVGGRLIQASDICDNPAHPGKIPIDADVAAEVDQH